MKNELTASAFGSKKISREARGLDSLTNTLTLLTFYFGYITVVQPKATESVRDS